jgi:hypothetical protein
MSGPYERMPVKYHLTAPETRGGFHVIPRPQRRRMVIDHGTVYYVVDAHSLLEGLDEGIRPGHPA